MLRYVDAIRARARSDIALEAAGKLPNPIRPGQEDQWMTRHLPGWQVFMMQSFDTISQVFGRLMLPLCIAAPVLLLVLLFRRQNRPGLPAKPGLSLD
jgi:hypothetical protein